MKKKAIWIISCLIVIVILISSYFLFFQNNTSKKKVVKSEQVDSIRGYDYKLYDNSTELYKSLYKELKELLESGNIDEEKYALLLGKLFISDFYNLDNKVTNHDIGGLEIVHSSILENFKLKAEDTLYKYVETDVYGDRKQELPVVEEILDSKVEKSTYKLEEDNKIVDSFVVTLSWKYKKDLGYQDRAELIFIKEDKKLSLIEIEEI